MICNPNHFCGGLFTHIEFCVQVSHTLSCEENTHLAPPEMIPDFWKRVPSSATDYNDIRQHVCNIALGKMW